MNLWSALHLAGFLGTAFVLSMFLNNTSSTAMMLPIVAAVVEQYQLNIKHSKNNSILMQNNVGNLKHFF